MSEPTPTEMKEEEARLEELKPLEVIVKNQPEKEKEKNPTSYDTIDEYGYKEPTDEEIKEMTDAQ